MEISKSDWHDLMNLANEQKLLPVVYHVLHSSMPRSIKTAYRSTVIHQVACRVSHTEEFLQVYNQIKKDGFQAIVVKGIVCRSTYDLPDSSESSSDEDLYAQTGLVSVFS